MFLPNEWVVELVKVFFVPTIIATTGTISSDSRKLPTHIAKVVLVDDLTHFQRQTQNILLGWHRVWNVRH
jgi:hypothetical protein